MLAASGGFLHCVKALVEANADLTIRDFQGRSCLDVCSTSQGKGCLRTINLGLEGKMEKRMPDSNGKWKTCIIQISEFNSQMPRISMPTKINSQSCTRAPVTNWEIKPLERKWIEVRETPSGAEKVKILSYNILAQCYTRANYFPWATAQQLDWTFRSKNLLQEITSYRADILCFQEVDHFEFFQENLSSFCGIYKQRTGTRREGCAIFFNTERFQLVSKKSVEFNSHTNNPRLKKDNIALFVTLECIPSGKRIVAGTTHLFYKSKEARDQQAACFLEQAKVIAGEIPFVLCGDFNCMPQSDTISRFTDAALQNGLDFLIEREEFATFLGGKNSKKWYDFLFHSVGLDSLGVLSLPNCGESLLPNEQLSSDHVALVEDFLLI
mmetsp:Transcript_3222/g.4648  ORF Transcript_3222/g.4648 Transcript_3222/m.4648 type:complete len:382 (-) Transcript_3222:7-1152(-)